MNKLVLTLCILASTVALSACENSKTYKSGSSYAYDRTAGEGEMSERVFRSVQSK